MKKDGGGVQGSGKGWRSRSRSEEGRMEEWFKELKKDGGVYQGSEERWRRGPGSKEWRSGS